MIEVSFKNKTNALNALKNSLGMSVFGQNIAVRPRDDEIPPLFDFVPSPRNSTEEITIQTRDFGRHHFGWVDPCYNAHPQLPAELADVLLGAVGAAHRRQSLPPPKQALISQLADGIGSPLDWDTDKFSRKLAVATYRDFDSLVTT